MLTALNVLTALNMLTALIMLTALEVLTALVSAQQPMGDSDEPRTLLTGERARVARGHGRGRQRRRGRRRGGARARLAGRRALWPVRGFVASSAARLCFLYAVSLPVAQHTTERAWAQQAGLMR